MSASQLSRKPDLPPADVSRKRTSPSSGKGRSPRNPACTGLVLLSRTLSLILWNLPLVALSATRSYHSADCDTDHAMVCSKVRLSPRKQHRSKPTGRTRINVARTLDPQRREQFVASIEQSLQDLPDQDAIYNAAITAFGKRERPNQDWDNANLHVMVPIIETKREALLAYKQNPCETLSALRSARSIAQRTARRCANDYWLKLCESIQNSADCGNVRGMYDGIKKSVGSTVRKMVPLKSTSGDMITDRDKQMERWVEHYSELYSRERVVTNGALNATRDLPTSPQSRT